MDEEVKVAILEQKQEVLEQFVQKLDSAIEKIAEVNTNVSKMLAVHETRLQNNEQQREILHQRISDMKKEITEEFKSLKEENRKQHSQTNERLEKLERWRWFVVGVATVIGFSLAQMESLTRIFG